MFGPGLKLSCFVGTRTRAAGNTREHLNLRSRAAPNTYSVFGPRRYLTARLGSGPFDMTGEEVLRAVMGTEPITTKPSTLFVTSNGGRGLRNMEKRPEFAAVLKSMILYHREICLDKDCFYFRSSRFSGTLRKKGLFKAANLLFRIFKLCECVVLPYLCIYR